MTEEQESNETKKGAPYLVVLIIGVTITFIVTCLFTFLGTSGALTSWKSLPSPPSEVSSIIDADVDNIWIETKTGQIYTLGFFCYENNFCLTWLPVHDRDDIDPYEINPIGRGKDCNSLGNNSPGKPLFGKIQECVLVPAYGYPDPEWGIEVYYALMSDGKIMYWKHGSGILSVYAMFFSTIAITIAVALIITLVYAIIFIARISKRLGEKARKGKE